MVHATCDEKIINMHSASGIFGDQICDDTNQAKGFALKEVLEAVGGIVVSQ